MAKNQKIMNKSSDQLFHKVNGSKVKDGVTPPMLNTVMEGDGLGVPMTDVSSPNKLLPLAGAAIGIAGRWLAGKALRKGALWLGKRHLAKQAGKGILNQGSGWARYGGAANLTNKIKNFTMGTGKWSKAASIGTAGYMGSGLFGSGSDNKSNLSQNLNKTLENANKMGDKITGALGSELRRQQYDAKGWKYDHTISGDHEGSYNSKKKPVKKVNEVKPSGTTTTTTSNTDKQPNLPVSTHQTTGGSGNQIKSKKQQKKEKLTNKANIAAAQGNYNKANRLNRRSNRVSPNVVNLDMGAEYSQNLQSSGGKTKVGAAIQGVKAKVGGAVSNLLESNKESNNAPKNNNTNTSSSGPDFNQPGYKQPPGTMSFSDQENKFPGTPFKRKGCGPRGLGGN